MSQIIIAGNPGDKKAEIDSDEQLSIAEFFCDTIQGEGIYTGQPAAFLRMQHCTLECNWCDTQDVWRHGNPYSFDELFELMVEADLIRKLKLRQHLVLTGGSPLRQLDPLYNFIRKFEQNYDFKPYIEIENECTINPPDYFAKKIDCWNNSPKLSNSGNSRVLRYQPTILRRLAAIENSWFKFVIRDDYDWAEIEHDFIDKGLIKREQIILMPEGGTRKDLARFREKVVEIAIREGVRYSTREHVVLWDKATGV